MSTRQNPDNSYSSSLDASRSFEHEYQADLHDQEVRRRNAEVQQQPVYTPSGDGPGLLTVLVACKPFYPPLILYWLIAFPAISASWLLRTASFPFSWLGTIQFYLWSFLVKAAGAPYYLAYLFGEVGAVFAMPVIAIIWWLALSILLGNLREKSPRLYKKIFVVLGIAAAIPVALALIAWLFGSLNSEIVAYFWYGHDPYSNLIWQYVHRQSEMKIFGLDIM